MKPAASEQVAPIRKPSAVGQPLKYTVSRKITAAMTPNGRHLPVEVGFRPLLDGAGHFLHAAVAGGGLHDQADQVK